jgi:DinB superfamily
MTKNELNALKFPIGTFQKPGKITPEIINGYINDIETLPKKLRAATKRLTPEMLDTPYRSGGWTVRQLVHHIGHSHINAFTRLKLALTEKNPVIKPYNQDKWVTLPDTINADIEPSLKLAEAIHASWVILLKSLSKKDFSKSFVHPDGNTLYRLDESTGLYAWHCNHHLAHITRLKERMKWKG